jgi:hypothetical protein
VPTGPGDAGSYTATVSAGTDEDSATVRVRAPGSAGSRGRTAAVVLEGASGGVSAYNVTVDTPGTGATVASVEGHPDATLSGVVAGGEGAGSVTYRALFRSFDATSGNVTLLTVAFSRPVAREALSLSIRTLADADSTAVDRSRVSLRVEASDVSFADSPLEGARSTDDDPFPEDANGDGAVDLEDAFALAFDGVFAADAFTGRQRDALDYDGDGAVDLDDVLAFAFDEALA